MAAVESAARCETVCYQNRGGEDVVAAMRDWWCGCVSVAVGSGQ